MDNRTEFFKSYRFLQVLTGALYIFMAVLALKYSSNTIVTSIQIFGALSLVKGIFEILNRNSIRRRTNNNQYSSIAIGVVDVAIGIVMIVNTSLNLTTLSILFGIWFISDAVISLFLLDLAKKISQVYYYVSLIIYLIGSLIGLILLIAGDTTIISVPALIAIYFLLFGFTKLAGGILNKRDIHVTS